MITRTVSLTPIKSEVKSYIRYLVSIDCTSIRVQWPKLPGHDVRVTFTAPN